MLTNFKAPYKVNKLFYIIFTVALIIALIFSIILSNCASDAIKTISEIVKNLAYGCIASTIVAWLIDEINIRDKNEKAQKIYSAVFTKLECTLSSYIGLWAETYCCLSHNEEEQLAKHTWIEWFELSKNLILREENERIEDQLDFIISRLEDVVTQINTSIDYIKSQYVILEINDVLNDEIRKIISNFSFEFKHLNFKLFIKDGPEGFFKWLTTINNDVERYIWDWRDIRFFDYVHFSPYRLFDDKSEIRFAIKQAMSSPRPELLSKKAS